MGSLRDLPMQPYNFSSHVKRSLAIFGPTPKKIFLSGNLQGHHSRSNWQLCEPRGAYLLI